MRAHAHAQSLGPIAACIALACCLACGGPERDAEGVAVTEAEAEAAEQAEDRGPPVRGDWLVAWLLADPESLNPLTSNDAASSTVLAWVFLPLLTLDNETLQQRPLIASELPEVSEDKLTYTFRLRPTVTFSDGTPLTAEDVVFTVKAIKHPGVNAPHARNYFNSVRDVVAVDEHTVRFDLKEKYFRNTLVLGSISPLPRHYYDPDGLIEDLSVAQIAELDALPAARRERAATFAKRFNEDFHRNPMGPGAYVLRDPDKDLVTGERIVLRHRPDFWAPGEPKLGDGWVNRILFRVINDPEAALVALKNGDLDRIGMTPLQYRINRKNERFNQKFGTKVHVSPGYTYIGWNQRNRIFQDVRVRRALSHFVDKKNLVGKVLHGFGVPVESPIFIERPEYNKNLAPYPFDPERGRALLVEAGWIDTDGDGIRDKEIDGERVPLRFELISNSGNDIRRDIGLAVIDQMKASGIDARFRAVDWSIMLENVRKFEYDAVILGWAMSVIVPDAFQVWHSSQIGGSNFIGFDDPEVDKILEDYRVEFDPARRKELYDRFQQIIYDKQPYTFLFMQNAITAWDRRFAGVRWYPTGGTDLNEWWVPLERQKYS
jgi:peptide/nickel transport system substrate-binding protein